MPFSPARPWPKKQTPVEIDYEKNIIYYSFYGQHPGSPRNL
jgi:hypothetical protein